MEEAYSYLLESLLLLSSRLPTPLHDHRDLQSPFYRAALLKGSRTGHLFCMPQKTGRPSKWPWYRTTKEPTAWLENGAIEEIEFTYTHSAQYCIDSHATIMAICINHHRSQREIERKNARLCFFPHWSDLVIEVRTYSASARERRV